MMIRKKISQAIACTFLATACFAEDIDLYVGGEQVTGAETNVLIFLDNSANWSNASGWPATQGEAELDALKAVIDTLNESVNVGVMMHTRTGSTSGAYVRFAIRPMSPANRTRIKEVFDDIKSTAPNAPQDKVAMSADADHAIEETFRYFNSLALGFTAARDTKEDYAANTAYYDAGGGVSSTLADKSHPSSIGAGIGGYGYASSGTTTYSGPSTASAGCAKNYLIWIGNTSLDGSTDTSRLTAAAALINETATTTQVSVSGNSQPGSIMMDEWARFMHQYGVKTTIDDPRRPGHKKFNNIVTYTVDTFPATPAPATCIGDTSGGAQQISQHYVMQSVATQGGGKCYPAANTSQLADALKKIFSEIQAVNSVFASASLPVSVNTQGTFENQIYIGMFRPDAGARPRWPGNLKEYKFGRYCDTNGNDLVDPGEAIADNVTDVSACPKPQLKLFLADRNNDPALDQTSGTGFIDIHATSYWTTAQTPGFWTFFPDVNSGTDDSPDGPLVERGGAAYRLRNQFASGRNMYTCLGSCLTTSATSLNTQQFVTTNTAVTDMLNPGSKTVTNLTRSGNTVTATTSVEHGFALGDTVTISGPTTPAEYLGAFAITAVPTTTTFTYTVAEKPTDDTANARVSVAQTAHNVTLNVTVSNWTTGAATATATSNPATPQYTNGDDLLLTGGSYSYLNSATGGTAITSANAASFSYAVNVPVPTTPATTAGTSQIGATTYTNGSVQRNQNLVVVDTGSAAVETAVVVGTTSVTVAGAIPTDYNVTRTIEQKGTGCNGLISGWDPVPNGVSRKGYYCFRLVGLTGTATAQKIASPININITRTIGSQVATGTVKTGTDTIPAGSTLTVSSSIGYDGSWAIGGAYPGGDPAGAGTYAIAGDSKSFTFGPVTLSPAQPSGAYTATPGAGSTVVAATNLVSWVRGMDIAEDENQNGSKTDVRASVHGDVLHSRPLMFNFGSGTGIVGFYGSNDGLLHAIKGGTADSDGNELWSFIPEEFISYSKLSRLYRNEPQVRFPNLQCGLTPTPSPRDYFWDGVISGYQSPDGTTSTAPTESLIFGTMRRGGRSVYAIDVTTPNNPKFKWRISNSTTNFSDLAQTWSEVKPVQIKGISGGSVAIKKAVVFGAGYDAAEEDKPAGSVRSPTMGRGIYVVDMATGNRLAFLQPPTGVKKYSFAADVTPFDSDGDGYIDQIYAVDTGGNMFRFDVDESGSPGATWTGYHLAQLGDVGDNGGTDARKFLFAPAVMPYFDPDTNSTGTLVMAGSGDREKPLKNPQTVTCPAYYGGTGTFGQAVQDRFYTIVDKVPKGATSAQLATIGVPFLETNLLEVNADPDALTGFSFSSTYKGWYLTLKNETDSTTSLDEEKTVNAPKVIGGVLYFATNTPRLPDTSQGICNALGEALGCGVDPLTGLPAFNRDGTGTTKQSNYCNIFAGGGLPPTVTYGVVMIGDQAYYAAIGTGGSEGRGTGTGGNTGNGPDEQQQQGGHKITQTIPGTRKKIYWNYRVDE